MSRRQSYLILKCGAADWGWEGGMGSESAYNLTVTVTSSLAGTAHAQEAFSASRRGIESAR